MKKRMPGKFAHILTVLLTLLMTLTLFLSALSWQGIRLLTNEKLHHSIAGDPAVTAAQMERITATVNEVAAAQSFDPATVMALVTEDAVRDFSLQSASWWLGFLQDDPVIAAPVWDTQAMEDAVREDELFRESVKSTLRRSVARDSVAYPIAQTIQEAVLPIRTQLISFAMPEVLSRIDMPAIMNMAVNIPLLLAAVSLAMAMLILIVMHRCVCKGGMYIGSGLAASALLTLMLLLGVLLLDPAAFIAQANALLALQVSMLLSQLALPLLIASMSALVIGFMLIALHQKRMRQLIVRSIAA